MNIPDDHQKVQDTDVTKYRSLPIMTKYEFDQIISLRTTHLSRGAIPFVPLEDGFTVESNMQLRRIALLELNAGKLPYMVKRPIVTGTKPEYEYWKIKDLDLSNVRYLLRE